MEREVVKLRIASDHEPLFFHKNTVEKLLNAYPNLWKVRNILSRTAAYKRARKKFIFERGNICEHCEYVILQGNGNPLYLEINHVKSMHSFFKSHKSTLSILKVIFFLMRKTGNCYALLAMMRLQERSLARLL